MDEKKRPGGLTALAVINFIFAALSLFSVLAITLGKAFVDYIPMDQMTEQQAAGVATLQNMSPTTVAVIAGWGIFGFLLLLISGIGYLKRKKVTGRIIGSVYAILSIVYAIASATLFSGVTGERFGIGSIIGLIYFVLTLILLNTLYKDDLVN